MDGWMEDDKGLLCFAVHSTKSLFGQLTTTHPPSKNNNNECPEHHTQRSLVRAWSRFVPELYALKFFGMAAEINNRVVHLCLALTLTDNKPGHIICAAEQMLALFRFIHSHQIVLSASRSTTGGWHGQGHRKNPKLNRLFVPWAPRGWIQMNGD